MDIIGQTALKSKQPGDAQDYHLIAISAGPLSTEDFAAVYRELSVGTMLHAASTAGERAPWVTIGPFARAQERYLAIIRQDWTEWQDNFGRSVAAQCCLCLPDTVINKYAPSYRTLFANIPDQKYFLSSNNQSLEAPKLSITPLADELGKVLRAIEEIGFEFCSYVAAMLLISPVAIMRGQDLSVDDRLSFFDAVTSLLPYGARTELGVSTWMNSTSIEKIRLGFSAETLPNQKRIVWREPSPKDLQPNPVALKYYQQLNKLWNDPEMDKGQIISDLAGKRNPLSLRNVQPFLQALREINWDKTVYEAVTHNQGNREDVRALLKTENGRKFSRGQREELLVFLLKEPGLEDLEILRDNWEANLWVPASESVKTLRAPVFQTEVLWALCQFAEEKDWLNNLLEPLLDVDDSAQLTPTLELFYKVSCQLDYDKKRVGYLLRRKLKVLNEFLFIVAENATTEGEAEQVISWLSKNDEPDKKDEPSDKVDFTLYRIALGLSEKNASVSMIENLAELDVKYVERLVSMAAERAKLTNNDSNLRQLTPAVSAWLFGQLPHSKTEQKRWQEHLKLMQKSSASTSIVFGARLDALRLALDASLSDSLSIDGYLAETPAEIETYSAELIHALPLISNSQAVIQGLIKHLNVVGLETRDTFGNSMHLIGKLIPKVTHTSVKNMLVAHIKNGITKYPSLVAHEAFTHDIKEHLFKWNKGQELFDIFRSAFNMAIRQDNPVEEVVGLYLQMSELESTSLEETLMMDFADANYFKDTESISCFLRALREAFEKTTGSTEEASLRMRTLEQQLLRINSDSIRQHRDGYADELIDNLRYSSEMLSLIVKVLDEEQLQAIKQTLEEMSASIPGQRLRSYKKWLK